MQKIVDFLNGLYVEFVGLLFRLFGPKQIDPIISDPDPIDPDPIDPDPPITIYGLTITEGWD